MKPRERVLRAVLREEVDAVPISIRCERPEPFESLLRSTSSDSLEQLLRRLGVEYRGFLPNISGLGIGIKGSFEPGWVEVGGRRLWQDEWGVLHAASRDGKTTMYANCPLERMDVREYPFPEVRAEDFDAVERFRREHEDYCVTAFALQPLETACALFGHLKLWRLLYSEPWRVEYALDKLFAIAEEHARLAAEAGVDQVYSGDDVGAQNTMLISPQLWRKFLKHRYARLADAIHRHGAFFCFHSDGWIEPIIPDLIEVGVDVLEPLQPEAMDVKRIKELYGDRLSFEGGVGVQRLPFMSPSEAALEAKRAIEALGPTGYTLRPSHTILPDTSVEVILALYEAANRYRWRARADSPELPEGERAARAAYSSIT